jgi:transposase
VLEYNFNWKSLSAVAGLTALVRHIPQPLMRVWDRLSAHRSGLVRDYLSSLEGRIEVAYPPPYAPELNPIEYIWAHWKQHELPNVCPRDFWQLSQAARRTLRRMR